MPIFWVPFIRAQRQMANLSLRELSAMTEVSNPYLSQIERGLSEPSARVLKSIAQALNISAEALFTQAGLMSESAQAGQQRPLLRFCKSGVHAEGAFRRIVIGA